MYKQKVEAVPTTPFEDQRPGTSGLRKKTREFMAPRYIENFVQSVFDSLREEGNADFTAQTLIAGGDGRYYNRTALQTIIRLAAANGFGRVLVGRGGLLSTPAMSAVIRRRKALGGLILSASHNPGGIDADFGIKYNVANGGPAPEEVTEGIYQKTLKIERYLWVESPDVNLEREQTSRIGATEVTIIDPLADYAALMQEIFDFDALRSFLRGGFRMKFNGMHGATGPYALHILENLLGAPPGTVINAEPLEDFGGGHPDPNLVYAADFVRALQGEGAPDFGAACDGDGDRNMILGRDFFVTPGDSLALITEHIASVPGYRAGLAGVARSLPTSTAVDRVAAQLKVPCYETPTGWKYFGHLLDAGLCTLCGEESFGTGSNHVREKDGVWAVLCWLSLLASTRQSVAGVVESHWRKFGRSYFQRHDYEGLEPAEAGRMIEDLRLKLPSLRGQMLANRVIASADDASYTDPVDHTEMRHVAERIVFRDGSRIVCRLSGTGTVGATLRMYLECYEKDQTSGDPGAVLEPFAQAGRQLLRLRERFGRDTPTLVT